jgi:hypothetical protein
MSGLTELTMPLKARVGQDMQDMGAKMHRTDFTLREVFEPRALRHLHEKTIAAITLTRGRDHATSFFR